MNAIPPTHLPQEQVTVVCAAILYLFEQDGSGFYCIEDAAVMEHTGISLRHLQRAYQRIADTGAAQVGRSDQTGNRKLRPNDAAAWRYAALYNDVVLADSFQMAVSS